jgi:hypothetical protein
MNLDDLIRLMGEFLQKFKIDHFTFGAVAMNFWIPPRFTHDLDIVLCVKKGALPRLTKELNLLGFKITPSLQRKLGEGRLIKLPIGNTELDLKLCLYSHDYEALKRAQKFVQGPFVIFVSSAEDLVLYKLQYWRRQDQADVEKILAEYGPLDRDYIEAWLDQVEAETGFPVRKRWEAFLRGEISE